MFGFSPETITDPQQFIGLTFEAGRDQCSASFRSDDQPFLSSPVFEKNVNSDIVPDQRLLSLFPVVQLMQNRQIDLQAGESLRVGEYMITLVEIEDDGAVLQIEGPDGEVFVEPIGSETRQLELALA